MPVFTQGGSNPAAQTVPDVYTNVQTPPPAPAQGVVTSVLGIVGVGSWGPVNSPAQVSAAQALALFGGVGNRAHDLCTYVMIANQQGAQAFVAVRVTDGTDLAATGNLGGATCLTLTCKYTGSLGNKLQAILAAGSAANSWKITLSLPGQVPETFDNITGSGNAFWVNAAAAINAGQSVSRGPSQLAVASAGVGVTAPVAASTTLTGGADGASGVSYTQLLGTDGVGSARTGMYALRGMGCALAMLAECATPSSWSAQLAFALSEVLQMVDSSASGGTPASFAADMASAGVDSPWFKAFVGDWCYWIDSTNNVLRLVSPQAFYAGGKVAQLPSQSMLNKAVYGCAGTQKSYASQTYSTPDLQAIAAARGDVICNPCPGGSYFGVRFGRNTSSDAGRHQDAYTTMTDFLALTLDGAGGQFVGQDMTPDEIDGANGALSAFLQSLVTPPAGPSQLGAFSVAVTANNATGVESAAVQATYLGIVEIFNINLTGGQTVVIASQPQLGASAAA